MFKDTQVGAFVRVATARLARRAGIVLGLSPYGAQRPERRSRSTTRLGGALSPVPYPEENRS